MMKYVLGVLLQPSRRTSKVSGLFSRRGFNIDSLAVALLRIRSFTNHYRGRWR